MKPGSDSVLTFQCLSDEPLEVVHVFGVFSLGVSQDVPEIRSK